MSDWIVGVPSWRRAETVNDQTLKALAVGGVAAERVHLFVAAEELAIYKRRVDPGLVSGIHPHDAPGSQAGARKAVNDFIRASDGLRLLVSMDDDLSGVLCLSEDGTRLSRVADLPALFDRGFREAERIGATLWGTYPVANPFFMKHRVQTRLAYCPGGVFGQILSGRPHEDTTLDVKNDYERSLQHFMADGVVARLDWVIHDTRGYAGSGGLIGSRTPEGNRAACEELMRRYPGLVKWQKRKRDWPEIRLVNPK